jgi:photosystem II stability/assembly factor-like uncharacterized protein
MKKPAYILLILALSLIFLTPPPASASLRPQELLYSQNFDSGSAPEWQLEDGWQIAPSESGFALKGSGHVWARMTSGAWSDYFLRFRVRLDGDAALHANIRLVGPARYFIGLNRHDLYLSKQTGLDTFFNNLAGGPALAAGWHVVEIAASGGKLAVQVDRQLALSYTDPQSLENGGIAFESLGSDMVWVDDVEVGDLTPVNTTNDKTRVVGTPASVAPTLPAGLTWVRTGGPLGGLGYDIRMRPDNPDILFVTDAKAGVFKSVDGGQTWKPINHGITTRTGETGESIPIFCLTIDPTHPDTVWTGTQGQRGIFKSLDGGETWKKMDNGILEQGLTMRGFAVDPLSSDIVYAAGEVSSWEWNGAPLNGKEFDLTRGVVYKTTNGGQSWQRIWSGDNLARYIWIDPRNSDILYVSTGIFDREAANSDYKKGIPGGVGVIKSTDAGKTWKQVNQGLLNLYVGSLFMHPQNPDILLAAAGNVTFPDHSGVYLSTDGGSTWKQTLNAYVVNSVEFSTSDPKIAYAGDFGAIFRSEDGGSTWQQLTSQNENWGPPGIQAGQPIDFQVDPRNPERLFANEYGGGNFLSLDGGRTWTDASHGYTGSMVRQILVHPEHAAQVYAAARTGPFTSRDSGENWSGLAFPPFKINDWHAIAIQTDSPNVLLADLTCMRTLVRSQDGGLNWARVSEIPDGQRVAFRTIVFASSNPQTVYAGTAGFYSCGTFDSASPGLGIQVSTDGGRRWAFANDTHTQDAGVSQLAVDPQDARTVYAATFNRGLLKTTDGGKNWVPLAAQFTKGSPLYSVAVSPSDPQVVFFGRERAGLLRSEDGGQTWKLVSSGINPEATVTSLVFDPTDPQVLYLSDLFSGVYRSTNGGKTWKVINQGLEQRAINYLALSADGQHLYAASEGMGVFRLDLNGQPPEALPEPTAVTAPTGLPEVEQAATQPPASQERETEAPHPTASPPGATPGPRFPEICRAPASLFLLVFGCLSWERLRKGRAKRG